MCSACIKKKERPSKRKPAPEQTGTQGTTGSREAAVCLRDADLRERRIAEECGRVDVSEMWLGKRAHKVGRTLPFPFVHHRGRDGHEGPQCT